MTYGLPYMGSKSRICDWLMDQLPTADTFIDLFAGGCAVTHAAMISGKYKHVIACDIDPGPLELFQRAVQHGLGPEDWRPVTREEFDLHHSTDPLMSLVWSFGNDRRSYLWAREKEKVLFEAHSMLVGDTIKSRHQAYCQLVKLLDDHVTSDRLALRELNRLARIDSLHRLARVDSILTICVGSYESCHHLPPPSSSVVYADPPYIDTSCYVSGAFDHDRFYQWLRAVHFPVYISEYQMPPDFVRIAETRIQCSKSATSNACTTERLFLHERFAHPDIQQTFFYDPAPFPRVKPFPPPDGPQGPLAAIPDLDRRPPFIEIHAPRAPDRHGSGAFFSTVARFLRKHFFRQDTDQDPHHRDAKKSHVRPRHHHPLVCKRS